MKVLFFGDIFGQPGIDAVVKELPKLIKEHNPDFIIAQSENVSGRKGLVKKDYETLKEAGVNAFTMGNHVFAKEEIYDFIEDNEIIRPYNVNSEVSGHGSSEFKLSNGKTLRVTSILGITFNELFKPWRQSTANNFFDSFDLLNQNSTSDYHIIDFHAETTSEKAVFGLYVDGKVNAIVGTHTHVQTADNRALPKGSAFISDIGMTGPINCAIGADYESVYRKMRYNEMSKFKVSNNKVRINAVLINSDSNKNTIKRINYEV